MKPVVYLGPTLSRGEAARIVDAEFRPPVRRADLASAASARVVLIVDGEFHQSFSVSPKEILHLMAQGTTVLGSSSMGALRAAELAPCGMIGVGRIYEAYRSGRIVGDDEVALLYCPLTATPLTVPLVNVRFWGDALEESGVIDAGANRRILRCARSLYYADRTPEALARRLRELLGARRYRRLLPEGIASMPDAKACDARAALHAVADLCRQMVQGGSHGQEKAGPEDSPPRRQAHHRAGRSARPHSDRQGVPRTAVRGSQEGAPRAPTRQG